MKGKGIASCFSCRADGAASEGVCILVKLSALGITINDVSFDPSADGKVVTVVIKIGTLRIKLASVYLPSDPTSRGAAIDDIIASNKLANAHVIGADHNMVPDTALDTTRDSSTPYENRHSPKWESYLAGLGLEDTLRVTHGRGVKLPATRFQDGCNTRIDRFYTKRQNGFINTSSLNQARAGSGLQKNQREASFGARNS